MTIDEFTKALNQATAEIFKRRNLKGLGDDLVVRIRKRTRLGKGAKGIDHPATKLPPLKKNTVQRRKLAKRVGTLTGRGATPGKSGINRSGKTLNRMHSRVVGTTLEIKLDKDGEDVAKHLLRRDSQWEFMNLTKPEFKGLILGIERIIDKSIRRRLK